MNPNDSAKTNTLHRTMLAGMMVLLTAVGAHAQTRIAVVNMKVVFDGYWKTKQADVDIKKEQAELESEGKKSEADYQQMQRNLKELISSSNAPAGSAEAKRQRDLIESKQIEIRQLEDKLRNYAQAANFQVQNRMTQMRDAIVVDIRQVVDAKAKAAGYNLVTAVGAEIKSDAVVLYTAGLPDLTQEVLTELNSKAPPGVLGRK